MDQKEFVGTLILTRSHMTVGQNHSVKLIRTFSRLTYRPSEDSVGRTFGCLPYASDVF